MWRQFVEESEERAEGTELGDAGAERCNISGPGLELIFGALGVGCLALGRIEEAPSEPKSVKVRGVLVVGSSWGNGGCRGSEDGV